MPKAKVVKKEEEIEEIEVDEELIEEIEDAKTKVRKENVIELKKSEDKKIDFEFVCEKKLLTNLINKVKELKDEIIVEISKSGFNTVHTDETNVAMVDFTIPKTAFEEYKISNELKIGIGLKKLETHLKIFQDDITIKNGNNNLILKGESGRNSTMGLLSVLDSTIAIPKIEYAVEMKANAESILTMINIGKEFSDYLKFSIIKNKFYILVEGETDTVRFPICGVSRLKGDTDFTTLYSIEYLKQVMKFNNEDTLILRFGENTPLNIKFQDKEQKVEYLLAPRIESD